MNMTENSYKYKGYIHEVFQHELEYMDQYDLTINFISIMESKKCNKYIDKVDVNNESATVSFHFIDKTEIEIISYVSAQMRCILIDCIIHNKDVLSKYIEDIDSFIEWCQQEPNILNNYCIGNTLTFCL